MRDDDDRDDRFDFESFNPEDFKTLKGREFDKAAAAVLRLYQADRQENQLRYYRPVSKTARKIHEATETVLGAGGGNGCISVYAPVLMADGSWRPLGDVRVGDRVIGADPETGETRPCSVVRTYRSGCRPLYRITFSDGGSFEATADHRVPLYLGSGRKTTKGNPQKPHKRKLADYLEAIDRRGKKNPSKRISAVSPYDIRAEGEAKLPIHPYLLGALIGDGSFTGGRTIKFHNVDAAVIERVRGHVEDMGLELRKYSHGCEYGLSGDGGPNPVSAAMRELGLFGVRDIDKFIPELCFCLPRHLRMELLAGLVDTDGTTDWFCSASDRLARGFERLVHTLGGKATRRERKTPSPHGIAWGIYWRMNDRVPLACSRKQAVNQRGREIDYRRRVCRDVMFAGWNECGDIEVDHPSHCYVTEDYTIVSNSSKTETCIVELLHLATGIIPDSLRDTPWQKKFKGPRKQRIVVESLTTTLHTIILPKFKWWVWTGLGQPGGPQGHWGWLPKWALIGGSWDKSWSEKLRLLRFLCRDPDKPDDVLGESSIQFMAHGQEPQDFASGDFDEILHDEPPRLAIWTENEARTMRANGRMLLAMTWPDDPAIPVDWIHDKIYSHGRYPNKRDDTIWIEMSSFDNPHLNQESLRSQAERWDATMRAVRFEGKPIRFSNRVHPLFTDQNAWWCFSCKKDTFVRRRDDRYSCVECDGHEVQIYNHVSSFDVEPNWPTVFLIDPHPRKAHMMMWAQISPQDDIWVQLELNHEGGCEDVAERVLSLEEHFGFQVAQRWMDPNMGASPASAQRREQTWRDEFSDSGLRCDLADDFMGGRKRIDSYLAPDPRTYEARIHINQDRCPSVVSQMLRYCWADYKKSTERDQMQKPRDKYDDYPTLMKYLLNSNPEFSVLRTGSPIISRRTANIEARKSPQRDRMRIRV